MFRFYGKPPYRAVLVHGGPGAPDSLKNCAKELAELSGFGIAEAVQTKLTINELINELNEDIKKNCSEKVTVIGHSWGAWLSAAAVSQFPSIYKNLVLVSCPPLEDKYLKDLIDRRFQNLSIDDDFIYKRLLNGTETREDIEKMPELFKTSDNYCLRTDINISASVDSEVYEKVWKEAAKLRSSGELLNIFSKINKVFYIVHGSMDPHPVSGVTEPIKALGGIYKLALLNNCGHSPFNEKYAFNEFYQILIKIM